MSTPTCAYDGCGRPVYQPWNVGRKPLCIFHCEEKDAQEFRNALARQIREWRNTETQEWDFRGWVFVDVAREREYGWQKYNLYTRAVFPVDADFSGATFSGKANFTEVSFQRELDLSYTSFAVLGDFCNATIGGEVKVAWPGEGYKHNSTGAEVKRGRLLLKNLKFEQAEHGPAPVLDLRKNPLQDVSHARSAA